MVEMNHLNDVAKDDIKSELSRHPSNQETSAESVTLPADTGKDIVLDFMDRLDPSIKEAPISMQEARRVLRKVDLVVLPIMCATTILGAVDKNAIGNTAIMGIMEDANLRGREFSLLGSLFFIGYLVLEWPMSYLIQRLPVAKLLAVTVFFWGVLAMSLAAVHNFAGLAVVRFLMGGLESIVYPANSILTVMWYKTSEQPVRTAIWFNTVSTAVVGAISYGVAKTHTSLGQWELLYLILGAFTLLWSVVVWVFLPDSPVTCWQLSDREKWVAIQRVRGNNTGVQDKTFKMYQVVELLSDPKTWLLLVFAAASNVPNGGISSFSGLIVSGFGFDSLEVILINLPTGVLGTAFQILLSIPSMRLKGYRCAIIVGANLIPLVCTALLWQLPRDNKQGLLASYLCFWTYFTPYVLSTSLPMANVSGHTKKITMNALWFIAYSLGNIIGPQAFIADDAPSYTGGFIGLLVSICIATVSIGLYGLLCRWENARRDRAAVGRNIEQEVEDEAFTDRTDKEKPSFRYTH